MITGNLKEKYYLDISKGLHPKDMIHLIYVQYVYMLLLDPHSPLTRGSIKYMYQQWSLWYNIKCLNKEFSVGKLNSESFTY